MTTGCVYITNQLSGFFLSSECRAEDVAPSVCEFEGKGFCKISLFLLSTFPLALLLKAKFPTGTVLFWKRWRGLFSQQQNKRGTLYYKPLYKTKSTHSMVTYSYSSKTLYLLDCGHKNMTFVTVPASITSCYMREVYAFATPKKKKFYQ